MIIFLFLNVLTVNLFLQTISINLMLLKVKDLCNLENGSYKHCIWCNINVNVNDVGAKLQ